MLEQFLAVNNVAGKLVESKEGFFYPKEIASACEVPIEALVKCRLFVDKNGLEPVLAVFLAGTKINVKKLEEESGLAGLFPAADTESIEITGFEAHAIPPISIYGIKVFLDKKVLEKKEIACLAEDNFHALKTTPQQIQEHGEEVQVADITQ